ncbi:ComEA family DNA-binding protein [Moraxella marmotae]|uniref:ComEA family DNA-binding protein n=1 Tax=Moraxella marmotae TaxID=3344520 RepID=UPI0035F33F3E
MLAYDGRRLGMAWLFLGMSLMAIGAFANAQATPAAKLCYPDAISAYQALTQNQKSAKTARLNINTATVADFVSLTGVGHTTAQAIVDYRTAHGQFVSVDELLVIKGIGQATLNKNRHRLSVIDSRP